MVSQVDIYQLVFCFYHGSSTVTIDAEEHVVNQDMEDDNNIDEAKIISKEALQLANWLKTFFLNTSMM
jgi:hypothetical protein